MENKIWSPEYFLNRFASTLLSKIRNANDKMSPANIQKIQQQWLQMKGQRLSKDLQLYTVQVKRNHFNMANSIKSIEE